MLIKQFQKKYGDRGGMTKLTELRSLYYSQQYIAGYFGVTRERIRQWMLEFFGSPYDPRPDRVEAIIANMVEFAKNNSMEDFTRAFINSEYYDKALEVIKKEKIYVA